ncbi:MAG: dTDP-4-dehydrorhamnose reductase [Zoogloeaceae bacterium]|jgi:dTDP-4-dehydrorhamnose reductase|nr:dTDP-4-dehydrorhamnose reductase [Zoogloeaceae bacterium]
MSGRFLWLLGRSGQLGSELLHALLPLRAILGDIVALDRQSCDLSRPAALRGRLRMLAENQPPWAIVNAAAYTAVDRAEREAELAFAINGEAPGILGEIAAASGALVVHYSTDYVFDGEKKEPYREDDEPHPLNVYGQSKLMGERALWESGARYLIFRTSWVFGAHGDNFLKTMLRLATERETLAVVADQHGAPTSAAFLANVTARLLEQCYRRPDNFPLGLYHLSASGATSWYGYAAYVFAAARAQRYPLKLLPDGLIPLAASDYHTHAMRPANSRLDCTHFKTTFSYNPPPWQQGVEAMLPEILRQETL